MMVERGGGTFIKPCSLPSLQYKASSMPTINNVNNQIDNKFISEIIYDNFRHILPSSDAPVPIGRGNSGRGQKTQVQCYRR